MALIDLERALRDLSPCRPNLFGAACAERFANIYLWVASRELRALDGDIFVSCLDYAWNLDGQNEGETLAHIQQIGEISDFRVDLEPSGPGAYALDAAIILRTVLEFIGSGDFRKLVNCSRISLESGYFIDKFTDAQEQVSEELAQAADLRDLAESSTAVNPAIIRQRARDVGRRRLALVRAISQ